MSENSFFMCLFMLFLLLTVPITFWGLNWVMQKEFEREMKRREK